MYFGMERRLSSLQDNKGLWFMRHTAKIVSLIAAVAALALAGTASATSITWTTTAGNCLSGYTCNSSEASFLGSDGTTVVTAKAWAPRS